MLTLAAFLLHRERVKLVTSQATNQAYALCVLLRMMRRRGGGGGHNVTRPHTVTVTSLTVCCMCCRQLHMPYWRGEGGGGGHY